MTERNFRVSEDKLQEYIDGRLSEQDEAAVAAQLLADPEQARYVQRLREQDKALKALGANILSEPIPERLKSVLSSARQHGPKPITRLRRQRRFEALAYAGALAAGLVVGWFGHANYYTGTKATDLALLTGAEAHRFYSQQKDYPIEFGADREAKLAERIQQIFGREVARPDLADLGYSYLGGRLLPWSGGPIGLQLYENDKGRRVSVLVWSRDNPPEHISELPVMDGVRTAYGWKDGLSYAVVCDQDNDDFDRLANAVIDRSSSPEI